MKVFISFSGDLSKRVAEILRKYLPLMIQELDVFMSKHDIESGSRWASQIARELEQSSFGILCLTADNLQCPWILFEAGALTKHTEGRACGLLIGALKTTEVDGPLTQFQNCSFSKEELRSLLGDINLKRPKPLPLSQLEMTFDKWWPDLERGYKVALKESTAQARRPPRGERDLLEETLKRIRSIEKTFGIRARYSPELAEIHKIIDLFPDEKHAVLLKFLTWSLTGEIPQQGAGGQPIPHSDEIFSS